MKAEFEGYVILEARAAHELVMLIDEYRARGWKLAGGVSVVVAEVIVHQHNGRQRPAAFLYHQAMFYPPLWELAGAEEEL